MEETSDSAITGQSILARIGERLSAMVIPAESLPPSSLLPSSFISFLLSPFSFHRLCLCLSHFSFLICHLSFLIFMSFSFYCLSPFPFLISHLSFLILSSFSFYCLSPFPFVLFHFIVFLISHLSFLICHLLFCCSNLCKCEYL